MIDFEQFEREMPDAPIIVAVPVGQPANNGGNEPEDHHDHAWADEEAAQSEPPDTLPPIIDAVDFIAVKYDPVPELIKGLVHQGTKVVIGGGSKSFKTWTQLDAGISVAYGKTWLGHDCTPGRVLFINLEIKPEFFQTRLNAICKARGIEQCAGRLDIWNLRGHAAAYRVIIPKIIKRIKELGYALVIIDPIYKLYGTTDENSASEVAQLLNELERVTVETKATVMFGAHYSKGNQAAKESIDRISGSGVFARDPDTILPFTKHETEGSFVVEPILRNLPPITPFVVTWNHPLMERDESLDPSKLKLSGGRPKENSTADIYDLLPEAGLDGKTWEEKAKKTLGMSKRTFDRLKSELKRADAIILSKVDDAWRPLRK
jgi:hypothetical protein